uniref:Uncharacterized protein n=2 Tax=Plectus sambesii TaxID=2011161 RepID=A0A914W1I2_9BILA
MAQEEKSALKEAIKAVKERKNELKLQQKTIANLKAEIAKVEQQKAKDAKRKAELKLQIDAMLHTIEERRALRKIIEQYTSDAEAVQQETWADLAEVEEQLQTGESEKMTDEFTNMKIKLSDAVAQLDAMEQQKRLKDEDELTAFREDEAQWLATIEKGIDEMKTRLAARDELNRQKEEQIARRKEQLAHLRAVHEERQHIMVDKRTQTRESQEELDLVTTRLQKAKECEGEETGRRDAAKKRLEASEARRAELLAEKAAKSRYREERRANHDAKKREIADEIEAERNAIDILTLQQTEAQSEFNALYVREKMEFEALRSRMADEADKLKLELDGDMNAVNEMRAEIAGQPSADELRALVDQLRAEVREMIEMNVKLAQEEKALEEKENIGGSPAKKGGDNQPLAVSCSRRLAMSVASPSQQLLSPALRPLSQPTPPKRFGRVSGPAEDRPSVTNVAKTKKRSTATKYRKSDRLSTPKQSGNNSNCAVDSTPTQTIANDFQMNTPKTPPMLNDDTSLASDNSTASLWSPLYTQ